MTIPRIFRNGCFAVLSVGLLAVVGCTDPIGTRDGAAPASAYDRATAQNVLLMAELLAEGLEDEIARQVLHESLRASPLYEYKLDLAAFLGSPDGEIVLAAMSRHPRATQNTLQQLIGSLPPIDLYVPHPQHRQTWRYTEPIAVAALVDETSPLFGNLPDGVILPIDRTSWEPTTTAVLLLGPSEAKGPRQDALRPRMNEEIIEPPVSSETFLSEPVDCAEPDCGDEDGGGGGGGGNNDALRIVQLSTNWIIDNNFPWEGNEFELHSTASNGTVLDTWRCTGILPWDVVTVSRECFGGNTLVNPNSPEEVDYIDVDVWETDGWPNPDDAFADYLTPPANYISHPPRVIDNSNNVRFFVVYQYPDGHNCAPSCLKSVELQFTW
jgi:hypothetical protein